MGYGLQGLGSIVGRKKSFSLLHSDQIGSRDHPLCYPTGFRVSTAPRGHRDGYLRPYSRIYRRKPLLFLSSSSSVILTKLSILMKHKDNFNFTRHERSPLPVVGSATSVLPDVARTATSSLLMVCVCIYMYYTYIFISRKFTIYSTYGAISKYVVRKHLCGAIIQ
jgi:hypothetical protein